MSAAADTCKRGHPWTPENTRLSAEGWRTCRTCVRERSAARLKALQGQPCKGCGREGVYLDTGSRCARCRKRVRQGIPLDAPPLQGRKPEPKAAPLAPKSSKLPKGWYDTKPPAKPVRKQAVSKDDLDVGPILPTPPELSARCLRLLTRHDAADLAVMLGLAEETPESAPQRAETAASRPAAPEPDRQVPDATDAAQPVTGCPRHRSASPSCRACWKVIHGRPHKPDWTADGTCRRCTPTVARKRADFLAEVERLLDAGVPSDQIASRVGYGSAVSLRRRLDTLDRHDLARRLKPYTRERKAS